MNPFRFDYREIQIACYESGSDLPQSIVFLHGNSSSSQTWKAFFDSGMKERYHLVAFDFPGHGASDRPSNPAAFYSMPQLTDLLKAVLRTTMLDRLF